MSKNRFWSWLPQLSRQVWILAVGRLLSQTGTGFTLFYAPIFFVNQVGLSSTAVGIALGSAQISGVIGRVFGGSCCDSPRFGRRWTLLLSAIISALSSFVLAFTSNFMMLILGNLLLGLGIGLYWPATETIVADLTTGKTRNEAYAITRLGDNIGLQVGIIMGGVVIATTGAYRLLFVLDGLSFLIFFVVIYLAIAETYQAPIISTDTESGQSSNSWMVALSDRTLLIYVAVNILFTFYMSQIHSTIPLYLNNFVKAELSSITISALFAGHTAIAILLLLPMSHILNPLSRPHALIVSAILWGIGFLITGLMGIVETGTLTLAILGLGILAIATVTYSPAASSLAANLAPDPLRGIYLAINSQCWAIGYLIGPPLGGLALDQTPEIISQFWLGLALSVLIAIAILQHLHKTMNHLNN
ncbi:MULTISPECIES: MFS transporter [Limnospira]|uniref:Major facilitator superfamily transporter n=1 Tax=Limnospira platensis NIES-46 TaxID=1236695 RepID=A0A5M3T5L4_LIMPL|nr:MFS transporter [Arthrospira platensis]MDT9182849.1 MFS transporter [Limnospira sp. PMC 289.06]GCE93141.1 major facilitator superfamily transporter [Arthrospira platensis NIES-46]